MKVSASTLTVVDFETTGVVGDHPAEPWQIGFIQLINGSVESTSTWESLLRTGERPFNRHAPGRWHELRDDIRGAPLLIDLVPDVRDHLFEVPLVAHNVATERTILQRYCPLHKPVAWIDTLVLARHAWPGLPGYSLEALIEVLQLQEDTEAICPGRSPHDALFDAVATAFLLEKLLTSPGWQDATVADLARLSTSSQCLYT